MKANLLKLSLIAAASFVVSNALAADLPRPVYKAPAYVADPIFSWTGFYIGANAGYGFGKSDWDFPAGPSTSPKGFVGGAQLGYNYQIGSFVFGLEGDYDYSAMKGDTACGGTTCTITLRSTFTICCTTGMMMMRPGPLTPEKRPSVNTTPRSYSRRMRMAEARNMMMSTANAA